MVPGVSSHCDLCFFGVGVATPASLGVASQVMPAGVAPGVAPPPAGGGISIRGPSRGRSFIPPISSTGTGRSGIHRGMSGRASGIPPTGPWGGIRIIPLRSCLCLLCVFLLNVLIPPVASLRPRTLGSSNSCCYRCTRKLSFGRHCGFLFSPPFSFLLLLHGNQAQGLLLVPLQSLLPHNNWEGAHRRHRGSCHPWQRHHFYQGRWCD